MSPAHTMSRATALKEMAMSDLFGNDSGWVVLLKAVLVFVVLVVLTLFNIWFERRVVARMQHRVGPDRKSTRLNSSHASISYAVFCLKKKNITTTKVARVD